MARRAPRIDSQFLLKARLHANRWMEQGDASLGLSPGDAQALADVVAEAQAATAEYRRLESAARAANAERRLAMKRARGAYGALVTRIDGFAKYTRDRSVWTRARLAAPARPGPRPIPSAPLAGGTVLRNGGPIEVRFKGTGAGVLYEIQRQVVGLDGREGPWATVAPGVGKTWTDECPPTGILQVRYRARAMRPGRKGPFGPANVSSWSTAVAATFGCGPRAGGVGVVELVPGKAA
jgi:hypothetical protein